MRRITITDQGDAISVGIYYHNIIIIGKRPATDYLGKNVSNLLGACRLLAIEFMMSNRTARLRSGFSALALARRPIDRPDSTSCTALLSCLRQKNTHERTKYNIVNVLFYCSRILIIMIIIRNT